LYYLKANKTDSGVCPNTQEGIFTAGVF